MDIPFELPKIASLIALAGALAYFLFLILRQMLGKDLFRRMSARHTFKLFILFAVLLAGLLLAAMILSYLESSKPPSTPNSSSSEPTPARNDLASRPVTISFVNTSLRIIMQECARQVGAVLALGKGVEGTFSISSSGSELSEVMDEICSVKNCMWQIKPGRPPVLFVYPKGASDNQDDPATNP